MLKWIMFLVKKIPEEQVIKLIRWLLGKIPVKEIVDTVCDWLMEQAKKTENEVDDWLVGMIHDMLYAAFNLGDERIEENPQ